MSDNQSKHRQFLIALWIALCLLTGFVVFFAFGTQELQELSFLALSVPAILLVRYKMADFRIARKSILIALPYLCLLTLSFMIDILQENDNLLECIILFNTWYAFWLASVLVSSTQKDVVEDAMRILLLLATPVFVFVLISQRDSYHMGRWEPYFNGDNSGAHPNWWGNMALGLGCCALAWRNVVIRFTGLAVAAYFMFLVQSRGAMVALAFAFILCSGYFLPLTPRRTALLLGVSLAGLLMVVFGMGDTVFDFIANDVMRLSDPQRGVGTGMTGRTAAYEIAWKGAIESPFFGNGMGTYSFVHNGFLITLAENGIFVLLSMLYMLITCMTRYFKARQWAGAGYILSYMVLLMTYPRTFNVNMTSLLMILIIMRGARLSTQSKSRQ